MNTNRYIVGDFIIYTSLFKEPVAEICEVCEASYTIRFMQGNLAKVTSKEIKPIPLTPEILEKNGWKKDEGEYCKSCIFLNKDGFRGWAVGIGEEYIRTIIFVHELQHLLLGLGKNSEMEV